MGSRTSNKDARQHKQVPKAGRIAKHAERGVGIETKKRNEKYFEENDKEERKETEETKEQAESSEAWNAEAKRNREEQCEEQEAKEEEVGGEE